MLVDLCHEVMIEDVKIIKSIGGIRDTMASIFLAELADIGRFKSYKHLIAFIGLAPSNHQSGNFVGRSTISKMGNRHLRWVIYLMSSCVVRYDNAFHRYFLKKTKKAQPHNKAIIATSHKLLRIIFSLLMSRSFHKEQVNA